MTAIARDPQEFTGPTLRQAIALIMIMAAGGAVGYTVWASLITNFAIEIASFDGFQMGALHSIREIPGFLAFTAVFFVAVVREQTLAIFFLAMLGLGTALTGFFPSFWGIAVTMSIMSVGFHYYETYAQSLQLQWFPKDRAPVLLGWVVTTTSIAAIVAIGGSWVAFKVFDFSYLMVFLIGGAVCMVSAVIGFGGFKTLPRGAVQRTGIVLRGRYWLYYALTFIAGARRQIFTVFAGVLLVEKFNIRIEDMVALLLLNEVLNMAFAPLVGRFIKRFGEGRTLVIEYAGLIPIFILYGLVTTPWLAIALFILDHLFFKLAFAMRTYFQKIADPEDIASTAAVAFTINHIAAVGVPFVFGLVWLVSPALVFFAGAGMAVGSLVLSMLIPRDPAAGNESRLGAWLNRSKATVEAG
ncbi:MAG: MFS transporter [Alphaproteobacteria bacterium]